MVLVNSDQRVQMSRTCCAAGGRMGCGRDEEEREDLSVAESVVTADEGLAYILIPVRLTRVPIHAPDRPHLPR